MNRFLSKEESIRAIAKITESDNGFSYDNAKHKITLFQEGKEAIQLRLPITLSFPDKLEEDNSLSYIILLIQAGSSALALCEDEEIIEHKVFKSYMVRKKQGKSQLKYLKTKGKSKAGSRVRLGNTVSFFEDINERLQAYFEEKPINRIALSCSKTLIPYLFNSKIECPFDKKDERILKIPKHVHTPGYDVLMETHDYLLKGELACLEEDERLIDKLLGDYEE